MEFVKMTNYQRMICLFILSLFGEIGFFIIFYKYLGKVRCTEIVDFIMKFSGLSSAVLAVLVKYIGINLYGDDDDSRYFKKSKDWTLNINEFSWGKSHLKERFFIFLYFSIFFLIGLLIGCVLFFVLEFWSQEIIGAK